MGPQLLESRIHRGRTHQSKLQGDEGSQQRTLVAGVGSCGYGRPGISGELAESRFLVTYLLCGRFREEVTAGVGV